MRFVQTAWWAREDSNLQPDRYERPALTIELRAPPTADIIRNAAIIDSSCPAQAGHPANANAALLLITPMVTGSSAFADDDDRS
jgi:hypothetical protein